MEISTPSEWNMANYVQCDSINSTFIIYVPVLFRLVDLPRLWPNLWPLASPPSLYHISWSPDLPPGLLTGLLPHLNHLSPPSPPCSESPPVTSATNQQLPPQLRSSPVSAPLHDGQLCLHWLRPACGRQPQCHPDHQAHHAGQGE